MQTEEALDTWYDEQRQTLNEQLSERIEAKEKTVDELEQEYTAQLKKLFADYHDKKMALIAKTPAHELPAELRAPTLKNKLAGKRASAQRSLSQKIRPLIERLVQRIALFKVRHGKE